MVGKYLKGCTASSVWEAKLAKYEMGKEVHAYSPAYKDADIVLKVRPPSAAELKLIKSGAMLVGLLEPFDHPHGASDRALCGAVGK